MINRLLMPLFLFFPTSSFCNGIDDFFIQKGNKIIGLEQAIKNNSGYIKKDKKDYSIYFKGKEYMLNSKSGFEHSDGISNSIFPNHFFVAFMFINVPPKKQIYLDNNHISDTDEQGKAQKYIYLERIGAYEIQLKDNDNETVESSTINIVQTNQVHCLGKKPMVCKTN